MPTKKTTKKKSVGKGTRTPKNGKPQKIGGALFTGYKLAWAEFSEKTAQLNECKLRLELEKEQPQYAPLVAILAEYQLLLKLYQVKAEALQAVQEKMAHKLGAENVKEFLESHTIDTDTGIVLRSPSPD